MRWIVRFLLCLWAAPAIACVPAGSYKSFAESETDDTITPPDPGLLHCDGTCITTPPATYTGPSFFWMGEPDVVPSCPVETPYQGLEGFMDDPMLPKLPRYARECLITTSDHCDAEGETCAPPLRPEFHVCIHQEGEEGCPLDNHYTDRKTLFDVQLSKTVTLCCRDDSAP